MRLALLPLLAALGASVTACGFLVGLGDPKTLADGGGAIDDGTVADDGTLGATAESGVVDEPELDAPDDDDGGSTAPDDAEAGEINPPVTLVNSIAVGPTHACAIVNTRPGDDPTVRCWGSNLNGQLGNDPTIFAQSRRPLLVSGLGVAISSLALASGYTFAAMPTMIGGYLFGWGNVPATDAHVQREMAPQPYQPSLIDLVSNGGPITAVVTVSIGATGGCSTLMNQSLLCWGAYLPAGAADAGAADAGATDAGATEAGAADAGNATASDGGIIPSNDLFESVVVGRAHACSIATRNVRDVECWGQNNRGQAGAPFGGMVSDPTPVGLAAIAATEGANVTISQIAAGNDTTCAVLTSGSVYCWGANDHGQLGNTLDGGRDTSTPTRVNLPVGVTVAEIAVGDGHVCAIGRGALAEVWCWGDNSVGQLGSRGPASRATPSKVQGLSSAGPKSFSGVDQIAAGGRTTCAHNVNDSTHVWCWGANEFGQAGQPRPDSGSSVVPYATSVAW